GQPREGAEDAPSGVSGTVGIVLHDKIPLAASGEDAPVCLLEGARGTVTLADGDLEAIDGTVRLELTLTLPGQSGPTTFDTELGGSWSAKDGIQDGVLRVQVGDKGGLKLPLPSMPHPEGEGELPLAVRLSDGVGLGLRYKGGEFTAVLLEGTIELLTGNEALFEARADEVEIPKEEKEGGSSTFLLKILNLLEAAKKFVL